MGNQNIINKKTKQKYLETAHPCPCQKPFFKWKQLNKIFSIPLDVLSRFCAFLDMGIFKTTTKQLLQKTPLDERLPAHAENFFNKTHTLDLLSRFIFECFASRQKPIAPKKT